MRCYPRYIPWLLLIWIWIIFWFLSLVNNFCRKAILFIGKGSSFIGDSKHRVEIELLWSSHSFSNESSKLSAVRQKIRKCLGEAFFCVVALFQCQKAWVTFIFCSFCANVRTYTTYYTLPFEGRVRCLFTYLFFLLCHHWHESNCNCIYVFVVDQFEELIICDKSTHILGC